VYNSTSGDSSVRALQLEDFGRIIPRGWEIGSHPLTRERLASTRCGATVSANREHIQQIKLATTINGEIAMAANLTSVVTQFLKPEVVGQISSFLGLDRAATQKVTAGAVPALLAGLSDLVTKPAGASQLSKLLLSSPQAGAFTDLLRKGDLQGLSQTGSGMLSGLFGGRTVDAMSQAIGKFAGIGDTGGKSLLSLLGPIVI
jgi:Bacterial protein of unknown function (DUF937)